MKLFKALLARVIEAKTDDEINMICADIDRAFQNEKIKYDENELLYRLINKMHYGV